MTLQECKKSELKLMLLAVNDLERKYKDQKQISRFANGTCPLCNYDDYIQELRVSRSSCCVCPWLIFDGHSCATRWNRKPIPERLERVARWQTLIKAAIKEK